MVLDSTTQLNNYLFCFSSQVNRPITLKKENIQTRNRKPNAKRCGLGGVSCSSKDKDPFPYGLLMKNEPALNGYHAQTAAMAVNSASSSSSSSSYHQSQQAAYAAAAAFHPLFSTSMLSSIGTTTTTSTSTSSSSASSSPIKSSYMTSQPHHVGVYHPYF